MKLTKDASLGMHLLEIEITTKCNLNCKHCYNRGNPIVHLPVKDVIDLTDFALSENVQDLIITGGEALLHPHFEEIAYNFAKVKTEKDCPRIVLQSNGILIPTLKKKVLRAFDLFHISFDITESVRSKIDHIIDTIKFLKGNDLDVYLFSTIHKDNMYLIKDMIGIADKAKVQIGFNLLQISEETQKLGLTQEEYRDISKKLIKFYKEGKILRPSCPLTAIFDDKKQSIPYIGNKGGCVAGIAACSVLPNGDVTPCAFLRVKSGNIYEKPLREIWLNSKIFKTLRDRSLYESPCKSCDKLSFCGGCRSRAYSYTGKLTGFDPMCFKTGL